MRMLMSLITRNRKLFFRDKGMLTSALMTPLILIVLYATFLANVFKQSFASSMPAFVTIPDKLLNGTVAAQLSAALLAVSCVTVTFCVNLTMIQDKASGARKDFNVAPVKRPIVYLGYFFATVLNSLMVNFLALAACLVYIRAMGWYLNAADLLLLIGDVVLMVLFGTVLSSIVCYPLETQGQMSAVGTIVTAGYGFICGAYMPISSFGTGLQKVLAFLPSTYGTSLLKNHMLRGVLEEMKSSGFPAIAVDGIASSLDCHPMFNGHEISTGMMTAIVGGTTLILLLVYLMMSAAAEKQ